MPRPRHSFNTGRRETNYTTGAKLPLLTRIITRFGISHMTRLDIPDLRTKELLTIIALAEYGSFVAAASHLKTSQPALTRTVKRVERVLGVLLFARNTRRVEIAPATKVRRRGASGPHGRGRQLRSRARFLGRHGQLPRDGGRGRRPQGVAPERADRERLLAHHRAVADVDQAQLGRAAARRAGDEHEVPGRRADDRRAAVVTVLVPTEARLPLDPGKRTALAHHGEGPLLLRGGAPVNGPAVPGGDEFGADGVAAVLQRPLEAAPVGPGTIARERRGEVTRVHGGTAVAVLHRADLSVVHQQTPGGHRHGRDRMQRDRMRFTGAVRRDGGEAEVQGGRTTHDHQTPVRPDRHVLKVRAGQEFTFRRPVEGEGENAPLGGVLPPGAVCGVVPPDDERVADHADGFLGDEGGGQIAHGSIELPLLVDTQARRRTHNDMTVRHRGRAVVPCGSSVNSAVSRSTQPH